MTHPAEHRVPQSRRAQRESTRARSACLPLATDLAAAALIASARAPGVPAERSRE
ncbi:MAG: hypothetical protein ACK52I_35210 [Pseudomonadota bacterium]